VIILDIKFKAQAYLASHGQNCVWIKIRKRKGMRKMPVIMVEGIPLSADQKRELVAILTKSASSIMNVSEQAFQVYIKENSRDNIGVGGILVSERNK